jgi:glyoxylase-like metal-dependent hydrolase (beta-lactamase superfamily II)
METVADGVYRLGSSRVNFYLIEEGAAVTLVDSGFPGYSDQVAAGLQELGKKPSDVKAIVLTHTHSDHIGGAPSLTALTGAPVLVHRGEAPVATGKQKAVQPTGFMSNLWRPQLLSFIAHAVANKGAATITVREVTSYEDDDVLDVPGKLRVVFTPGHSPAHSALMLEDRRVIFCGDAMATLAVHTGATGPMLHPFNQDRDEAIRSLGILARVDADILAPGHGEPWAGSIADAVSEARRRLE